MKVGSSNLFGGAKILYKTKKYYEADKQYYISRAAERKLKMRELVNNIKSVPCKDCENIFPPYVMDFDHLFDKQFDVSRMISNGLAVFKVLEEIDKCEIVCSNCHRIRTYKRKNDNK